MQCFQHTKENLFNFSLQKSESYHQLNQKAKVLITINFFEGEKQRAFHLNTDLNFLSTLTLALSIVGEKLEPRILVPAFFKFRKYIRKNTQNLNI